MDMHKLRVLSNVPEWAFQALGTGILAIESRNKIRAWLDRLDDRDNKRRSNVDA